MTEFESQIKVVSDLYVSKLLRFSYNYISGKTHLNEEHIAYGPHKLVFNIISYSNEL